MVNDVMIGERVHCILYTYIMYVDCCDVAYFLSSVLLVVCPCNKIYTQYSQCLNILFQLQV